VLVTRMREMPLDSLRPERLFAVRFDHVDVSVAASGEDYSLICAHDGMSFVMCWFKEKGCVGRQNYDAECNDPLSECPKTSCNWPVVAWYGGQ